MFNQLFNKEAWAELVKLPNIIYSLLATSTILSLSGIIVNNKIVASTGLANSFTAIAIVLANKDQKQLQKLEKTNSLLIKSQGYIDEQFNELKIALKNLSLQNIHYDKRLQELGTSYEQKFHIVNQELANLQQQNKDCQLDFKALNLLCEQKVNELKEDVTDKYPQTQKTIQSNKDQLNHRVEKIEEKLRTKESKVDADDLISIENEFLSWDEWINWWYERYESLTEEQKIEAIQQSVVWLKTNPNKDWQSDYGYRWYLNLIDSYGSKVLLGDPIVNEQKTTLDVVRFVPDGIG